MKFSLLLVAIDGSEGAPAFAGFAAPSREMDQNIVFGEEEGKKLLAHALEKTRTGGVEAETKLLLGTPAAEIVAYADDIKPDAIVMGTHGRSGLGRVLVGSVAENVLRHASCPVLTIRQRHRSPGATK